MRVMVLGNAQRPGVPSQHPDQEAGGTRPRDHQPGVLLRLVAQVQRSFDRLDGERHAGGNGG